MPAPSLILQTTYAELLERVMADTFSNTFPEKGTFTVKTVKDRRYWYFQEPAEMGRTQRYVGPETPDLLERISHHREAKGDRRERTALVSALVRLGLPRPAPEIGRVIEALGHAGVFRLRSVLVGTAAYQTYPAMLGERIPKSLLASDDIDIAQFASTSAAIDDKTVPMLEILKGVNTGFSETPNIHRKPTSYRTSGGRLRVDILTPNEGPDTDKPQFLPALRTFAQPLRFLDFLVRDPEPAVLLHGAGTYVLVPAPERYAIHKVIVSQRRSVGLAKRDMDIQQSEVLSTILSEKRPHELKAAWDEAHTRGDQLRNLLFGGMARMSADARDTLLQTVKRRRSDIPGLDLLFQNPPARYHVDRDIVMFAGTSGGAAVDVAISREALDDHFGANGLTQDDRLDRFRANRTVIERMAREKYLHWPVEEPGAVIVKTSDVPKLANAIKAAP